jgi:hypothetical protein
MFVILNTSISDCQIWIQTIVARIERGHKSPFFSFFSGSPCFSHGFRPRAHDGLFLRLAFVVAASLLAFRYTNAALRAFYRAAAIWVGLLTFLFLAAVSSWIIFAVARLAGLDALAADRVQHLQQLRPQQLLRWNRRPAYAGGHRVELSRQLGKHFVHHGTDGAQRMILPHAHLRRQVTEHMILLLIGSSHAFSYHSRLWIRSTFSAAC